MDPVRKLAAIGSVLRPGNCAMAAFATMLGYWISVRYLDFPIGLFFAASSTFAICGAGQAINDYFDRDVDGKSKKSRPIPSGKLQAGEALAIAIALFMLGISLAAYVNASAFGIAVAFSLLLYVYSSRLSGLKYFGNAVVALATAFTYVMGAALSGNYYLVSLLASASFFATWGREIAKDLEDFEADRGKKKTLPMVWGKQRAVTAARYATYVAAALGILPFASGLTNKLAYAILVTGSIVLFTIALDQMTKGKFDKSQRTYKRAMLVALLAYASILF